ncbi:MAG: ubiquinol oxidase subunit [Rhizobium sp.]|nr:ubiquinol oxidase subunit [Rhizobium sp.]
MSGRSLRRMGLRQAACRAGIPVAVVLLTSGCGGVLDPVGPVGAAEKQILLNSVSIMLAIVVPVIIASLAFAWWFRSGNRKAEYLPNWDFSGRIELVIWSIPLLTVVLLGGIAWIGSHDLEPSKPLRSAVTPLRVEIISLDWKWLFIYPEQGVATVNQLVVPTNTPLDLRLTSATVWNAFFIPQLGTMIYTMPGMTTRLHLQADRPGVYDGQSSHFSGDGFPGMRFKVHAVPPESFGGWASDARRTARVLDARSYAGLAKQSSYVAPAIYGAVVPGLFNAVATMKAPPPGVPSKGKPSVDVSPRSDS